ncbi:FecR family protein [Thauera chlorobenzoica]|uniref:Iron siderophore sensor protein n=1 Tax=Thauera chlorobenzoica TaxID=96773 RepID=A0A1H5T767_9RHOO|nr:FecR domain-containing protein [Thauera chlorobenzoica]APR04190.1 Iron siderophore sensor protein [Thauera chlorobenzoica]SEF57837.1 FecR family protein [Thauera chlorobenzoica]
MPPPERSRTPERAFEQALAEEREALKARFPLPPPRPTANRRGTPSPKTTAAAIVLVLLGGVLWLDPAYRSEHHASTVGERRVVVLADGSRITLDTDTALDVSWHLRSRRSTLERGRASFDVAPSVVRPFEVAAGALNVRVLGTVFDVRRDARSASVTVLEGRVLAGTATSVATPLTPGQRLTAVTGQAPAAEHVDPRTAAAWQAGRLVFERTPLREALAELARYRSAPLRLADEALGTLAVSGVFDAANTDQLLELLPRILPVRVVHATDGAITIHAAAPVGR